MTTEPIPGRMGEGEKLENRFRKTRVVVCTPSFIFSGYTYLQYQQRLLDALNEGLVTGRSRVITEAEYRDFLPLVEAEALLPDGRREYLTSTCFIGKQNILFVAEINEGDAGASGPVRLDRVHPYREKRTTLTKVFYNPSYMLVGEMHTDILQQLVSLLDSDRKFLPMTRVEITPELPTGHSRFDFIAVNKFQIISVTEV